MCVYVTGRERECVCECVWGFVWLVGCVPLSVCVHVRERDCVCVCKCVGERARERECVCVCVPVPVSVCRRDRERVRVGIDRAYGSLLQGSFAKETYRSLLIVAIPIVAIPMKETLQEAQRMGCVPVCV